MELKWCESVMVTQHAFTLKKVPHLSVHKRLWLYALLSTVGRLFPFDIQEKHIATIS